MQLKVQIDNAAFQQALTAKAAGIRQAAARALTATAAAAKKDLQAEMRKVFDRPTLFTINAPFVRGATPAQLEAETAYRDFAPKGTPAGKYLKPQIEGGTRRQKSSERRLSRIILGGVPVYLVPTRYAEMDAYGNPNRGQMTKILSSLGALGEASKSKTRKSRRKRRTDEYFLVRQPGRGLKPGIYRVMRTGFGRGVLPIYLITKAPPQYTRRLDSVGTLTASVQRHLRPEWQAAFGRHL